MDCFGTDARQLKKLGLGTKASLLFALRLPLRCFVGVFAFHSGAHAARVFWDVKILAHWPQWRGTEECPGFSKGR